MTITVRDVAQEMLGAYEYTRPYPHWAWHERIAGVNVGISNALSVPLVIFPGSETPLDWARDFFALPYDPLDHPMFGPVHAGFFEGAGAVTLALREKLTTKAIFVGHSLGAPHACYPVAFGIEPLAVVLFGSPKPGFQRFTELMRPDRIFSYCNIDPVARVHDCVTDLGPWPYEPVAALTHLEVTVAPGDKWHQFAAHHMQLYAGAAPTTVIVP